MAKACARLKAYHTVLRPECSLRVHGGELIKLAHGVVERSLALNLQFVFTVF